MDLQGSTIMALDDVKDNLISKTHPLIELVDELTLKKGIAKHSELLTFYLCIHLRELLVQQGFKEELLSLDTANTIKKFILNYLPNQNPSETHKTYFIIEESGDILRINWPAIRLLMEQEIRFNNSPSPEAKETEEYLYNFSFNPEDLDFIKAPPKVSRVTELTRPLIEQLKIPNTQNQVSQSYLRILNKYLNSDDKSSHTLFTAETLYELLDFMRSHHRHFNKKQLDDMLCLENNNGFDLFKTAIKFHPDGAIEFLEVIQELITAIGKDTLSKLFIRTQCNASNALMMAMQARPEVARAIFGFLNTNGSLFDKKFYEHLFTQTNTLKLNGLMLSIVSQPKLAIEQLAFCKKNRGIIGAETLITMLSQQNPSGWSSLSFSLIYRIEVAKELLSYCVEQKDFFDAKQLQRIQIINTQMMPKLLHQLISTQPKFLFELLCNLSLNAIPNTAEQAIAQLVYGEIANLNPQEQTTKTFMQQLTQHNSALLLSNSFIALAPKSSEIAPPTITRIMMQAYEIELNERIQNGKEHFYSIPSFSSIPLFSQVNYSAKQKVTAFGTLKNAFESDSDLAPLLKQHPELNNGRLGQLFQLCLKEQVATKSLMQRRNTWNC